MIRVAGFLALLALLFAAAFAVGRIAPVDAAAVPEEAHAADAMEATALPGLASAASGFRLAVDDTLRAPGRRRLSFRILDEAGTPVHSYDVLHERRMHVIVVRRDLSAFQHVHPRLGADGRWNVDVDLRAGVHRVFADFQSDGVREVLGADVFVGEGSPAEPLPAAERIASSGAYEVELDAASLNAGEEQPLEFAIRRNGREVTPEPYLGARGHLVVLREGDLAYIHAHAEEDVATASFETTLPSAGRYRAYLQFAHGGGVRTVEYTLEAT